MDGHPREMTSREHETRPGQHACLSPDAISLVFDLWPKVSALVKSRWSKTRNLYQDIRTSFQQK